MSVNSRRLGCSSPKIGSIRQKLQFSVSDGEDDIVEEDGNNSTGAESGFTEIDSPLQMRRHTIVKRNDSGSSPLNRTVEDDGIEFWDEEGLLTPSPPKPPRLFSRSPSPRKSSGSPGYSSPECLYRREDREGSSSPIPDCPDTPPHKTLRKLRLFDTPHTPKSLLSKARTAAADSTSRIALFRNVDSLGKPNSDLKRKDTPLVNINPFTPDSLLIHSATLQKNK
ncbi:hypothetical protein GJAV_G00233110 [Gymnothorax javanicus]|nr:hypothetical protein GJAV_G00233110 [Gymnothorax javanicus]